MSRNTTSATARAALAAVMTLAAAAALPATLLTGCGAQEGETVMTGGPETTTNIGKAPQTGTYRLFTASNPNPTLTVKLSEGDKLGFQKTDDGRVEAVYGDKTHAFPKGTAQVYWKVEK